MHLNQGVVVAMYITLAIITALIFFYSLVAKGVEKTMISGPMVFVAIGVLVGAHGLGWLGAAVIGDTLDLLTWEIFVYAVLSLTVIRIVPIFLSLIGTGESVSSRLFLGWFGPRGLASIVFAVIVMDANLPGSQFISAVVVTTVILSLVAHGISAKPLAAWLGRKEAKRVAR
jgi:NhaP-type Na+/H+ or K+/H+ antiporter